MKSLILSLAAGAGLSLPPLFAAHGGGHLPPEPPMPTGPTEPGDIPGGGGTGQPRRPGIPPATPGGPGSGPGPSAPPPAPPGGPSSGPGSGGTGASGDVGDWSLWWELNQHSFLELRAAIWAPGPLSIGDEAYLGQGMRSGAPSELAPSDDQLARRVVPALKQSMRSERSSEVLTGCLTALAKIGPTPLAAGEEPTGEVIAAYLANPSQPLRETAALCLGLLGGAAHLRELASLFADDERGRALSGGSKVSTRTRAFAAYGMGFLAQRGGQEDLSRYAAQRLASALAGDGSASMELGTACVHALSLIELPSRGHSLEDAAELPPAASREALAAFLRAQLDNAKLHDRTRAHVPRALARLARPGEESDARAVSETLLALIARGRGEDREVLRGAVQALGALPTSPGAATERRVREVLLGVLASRDQLTRQLALIALAEVSSRPGAAPEAATEVGRHLVETLTRGGSRVRPWAGLALGVQGHRLRALGVPLSGEMDRALRGALEQTGSAADAGAYAIALGLRGDLSAAPLVRAKLDRLREDQARGHMALALGLMADRSSLEHLQGMLAEAAYRPELIRPLAIAMVLLGDRELVPLLVRRIAETRSSALKAVFAWTLAHVGDARALEPLLALLADQGVPALTRGIAALGLGIACERSPLPWNAELARDANYPAAPPTFYDSAGGGVLNIR